MVQIAPENAVSFSSARSTKGIPSPRCASGIQIVCRLNPRTAEMQPPGPSGFAHIVRDNSQYPEQIPEKRFLLDSKALSLLYRCVMKPKSQTQILWQSHARDALLHGGTVDSFVDPYHPNLRFSAFRAYIGAVRDALFRPRKSRRQSRRAS
jgi:hypothetical protein